MSLPKPLGFMLRLAITAGACYLAFSQVNLKDVLPLLTQIPPLYLVVALLLVHAGQFLSAMRTRYYLHCQGIDLPPGDSIRLQYIGGLFNSFLPGGAGGDVYKAWWLKRHKQGGLVSMVKLMLANRLNGLWTLGVLICLLAAFSEAARNAIPYAGAAFAATAIAGTIGYYILARLLLREPLAQQWHAAIYSMPLQVMVATAAYSLCLGLGEQIHVLEYVLLFLLSCILAMAPISIGGIGVRELALLQGSRMLSLSEENGITLAFSYTILSLTIPLAGMVVHHFFAPKGDMLKETV